MILAFMLNLEIQELTLLNMLTALQISAWLDQRSPAAPYIPPRLGKGRKGGKEI